MRKILFGILSLAACAGCGFLTYYLYTHGYDLAFSISSASATIIFFTITVVISCMLFNKKTHDELISLRARLKQWTNISFHVTHAGDEVFNKLPIGIILYDETNEVKWLNSHAKDIFEGIDNEHHLSEVSPMLIDAINNNTERFILKYEKQTKDGIVKQSYDVIHNLNISAMYFFDVTERENIFKKYNERIAVIGILGIDNLEESLKKFDLQEKANVRGLILGEISDWFAKYECHLQAISDDRMFFITDKLELEKMINNKFDILSKVREISQKNRLKASISMGIACHDIPAIELGPYAQNAIELAERRGGDQVVVNIQGQKNQFFGGNTNTLEKNTLVEARMQTLALKEAVEASSNVIIMCHNFADCDAIGSMLAASHLIESSKVDYKMVFDPKKADVTVKKIFNQIKERKELYSKFITFEEAYDSLTEDTLLLITDTQSPKLVMFQDLFEKASKISVIDHHRAGDEGYINPVSYYVETSASSTVELISEMFMFYNSNVNVTPFEASIMLAGIIVDTNYFTFRSGTRTFEAASLLKSLGADMVFVKKLLRDTLESERQIARAFTKADVYYDRFAVVALDEEERVSDRTTLAKISDKLLTIEGIDTSFTIGRINETSVGISARSLDKVNVQVIMEEMGGGGHYNSAATQLENTTIEECKAILLDLIKAISLDTGGSDVKVILLKDVKGKGKKDEIIEVANGYATYLINSKLAVMASDEMLKDLEMRKEKEKNDAINKRNLLEKIKSEIQDKFIKLSIKTGADGKVFGSITTKDVCEEFEKQTGIHLDKKKVELPSDINSVGVFTATVKLDKDIVATFEVNVSSDK